MKRLISLFVLLILWSSHTLAGAPAGRNTSVSFSYDRLTPPARFDIWLHEPSGYSPADPQKWGRNTLTCLSRNDATNGSCMTAPVWFSANPAAPYAITLRFTHELSKKTVDIKVYGEKHMFINSKVFTFASYVTGGTGDIAAWNSEPYFDFYIVRSELEKLNQPGIWSATLKQNLRQWGSADCGGNFNDANVGCPGYLTIANWQANIRLEVIDSSNHQIYLPAFPHSAPVVNLNLTMSNLPGRPGGREIKGLSSLDMCLYDGNNSASSRVILRFTDDGVAAADRAAGAFSVWRRGGSQSSARDRVDYQVSVTNPVTGATEIASNGTDIVWQGTNDRSILRQVVLPGGSESVLCVPAPITLTTPAFAADSKTAGDYTGTLHVIYTPSTL
ncbi:phage tail protein [Serratia marcescens]|uniref:CfaE/CblD family pilus tip adhesin n=1 Tax=Serratia marcescens TaxID=615 RepID=UPI00114E7452|nr:CfaE/CblD family pilus tip adhesin [Serratia marcescens]QDI16949.1 phage tail protein [Serratia marcescens]QDI26693.1 phage tail protein [Serratia marcescens]QDI41161.1 phage tail protein [Serratia marcescens]QDI55593.1 phage tail protein [Serratia marcescens]